MDTRAEVIEILRQYKADREELSTAQKEYRRFLRGLPITLNIAQEREKAYRAKIHSDACKIFSRRRIYHQKRMIMLGLDLDVEGKRNIDIEDAYRNSPMMQEALRKLKEEENG